MITIAIIITNIMIIMIIIIIIIIMIIVIIIIYISAESQNEESALFVSFSPPRSPFSILISSQFSTLLESQSITHYVLPNVKAHSAILYKQRCYEYHQHPT